MMDSKGTGQGVEKGRPMISIREWDKSSGNRHPPCLALLLCLLCLATGTDTD